MSAAAMVAIIGCGGGGGGQSGSSATDTEPTVPRANSTQTGRPTRTPIAFPTGGGASTPTGTSGLPLPGTTTATPPATATPTATIVPLGIVRVAPARGARGDSIALEVRLIDVAPGVSIVATQNDLYFDPTQVTIAATAEGRPDCVANPEIGREHTMFGFLPAGCSHTGSCTGIRALVLSFTDLGEIPSGSLLYTCNARISAVATAGTLANLPCSMAKGSDPDGGEIAVGCPDGWVEITPDPVATQGVVRVAPVRGAPGESVALEVSLTDVTPGTSIVATQNDLHFDPSQVTFAATASGKPDCAVNPAIDRESTSFSFQPPGCFADDSCTGIRALVLSYADLSAIPSGSLLYTCNVSIAASAEAGSSELLCSMALGSDATGHAIPIDCPPARIEIGLDNPPPP
jgi:hypothetical protein